VIDKLHLHDATASHRERTWPSAVIDSLVDTAHPDSRGSIAGQFDAVAATTTGRARDRHDRRDRGASAVLGVAPRAPYLGHSRVQPGCAASAAGDTQNIVAGIDWAIAKGVRIINMSFAGPYDPLLQLALKKARDKGVGADSGPPATWAAIASALPRRRTRT